MSDTLVSIVICCYNRVGYLSKAIESAMSQKYDPVEILVVDDGSTDGTSEFVKKYRNKLRYYRHDNMGIGKTRTIACQLAKGEMIAFLDDDDLMPPNRITTLKHALDAYPKSVLAVGDLAVIDKEGKLTGNRWLPKDNTGKKALKIFEDGYDAVMWPKVPVAPHTTLFKKKDGQRVGWFNSKYKYASEDKDFFARLANLGPIVYVPEIVSYYRQGHTTLTSNSLRVTCSQLLLFKDHLILLAKENEVIGKRLKERILISLKKILRLNGRNNCKFNYITLQDIETAIKLLEPMQRLEYTGYKFLKIPLKNIINKLFN